MLVEWGNKNGTEWELRQGVGGRGESIYFVQSTRKGEDGQTINHCEGPFKTLDEAKYWVRWAI